MNSQADNKIKENSEIGLHLDGQLVRLPYQTSKEKLNYLINGVGQLDRHLEKNLDFYFTFKINVEGIKHLSVKLKPKHFRRKHQSFLMTFKWGNFLIMTHKSRSH